jgi:hypothetical protein
MRQDDFAAGAPASLTGVPRPGTSAIETACQLFRASPARAKSFALTMHEQAVWGYDPDLAEHWTNVVTELGRMIQAG